MAELSFTEGVGVYPWGEGRKGQARKDHDMRDAVL